MLLQFLLLLYAGILLVSAYPDYPETNQGHADFTRRALKSLPAITPAQFSADFTANCSTAPSDSAVGTFAIVTSASQTATETYNIQNAFTVISYQVSAFEQVLAQWNSISHQWGMVLGISVNTANTTANNAEQFVNGIIPDVISLANNGQSSGALALLNSFIDISEALTQQANFSVTNFEALQKSLSAFATANANITTVNSIISSVTTMNQVLNVFLEIWNAVAKDGLTATTLLGNVTAGTIPSVNIWPTIANIACVYQNLVSPLQTYAAYAMHIISSCNGC